MFTGIIECIGIINSIREEGGNKRIEISSAISEELKVDQSLSHSGICLTVIAAGRGRHEVIAVAETIARTAIRHWQTGDAVNLERSLQMNGRLDGHIVQGHVDETGTCISIEEQNGSRVYTFTFSPSNKTLLVDKGSIAVNGVSLTCFRTADRTFQTAVIPYTHEHTQFKNLKIGEEVNLEFDIVGKYIQKMAKSIA